MLDFISNHIADIVGYTASISMVLGYVPQTIQTIRTRKTDDIALGSFLLMAVGGLFFAIQGVLIKNLPLFLCNLCTTTMSTIIFSIKMWNDYHKRKAAKEAEKK